MDAGGAAGRTPLSNLSPAKSLGEAGKGNRVIVEKVYGELVRSSQCLGQSKQNVGSRSKLIRVSRSTQAANM